MREKIEAIQAQIRTLMDEAQVVIGGIPKEKQTGWSFYMLCDARCKMRLADYMMNCAKESVACWDKARAKGI